MNELEDFDALVGKEFDFYGVDGNCLKLNDDIWEVVEDESDGYRSYLGTVRKAAPGSIFFQVPVARVCITHSEELDKWGDQDELYRLVDSADGHVWLSFGTKNFDDYYPCFHFEYQAKPPHSLV